LLARRAQFEVLFANNAQLQRPSQTSETATPRVELDPDMTFLKKEGLSGRLRHYVRMRGVAWRVMLGLLPHQHSSSHQQRMVLRANTNTSSSSTASANNDDADWAGAISKWRREYQLAKNEAYVDPHAASSVDDPLLNNPLSTADDSPWTRYFENKELEQEIQRDIERTNPEMDFFRQEHIQEQMLHVLFVYARQHPDLGYKQGMHEILAPLIFWLHEDAQHGPIALSSSPSDSSSSPSLSGEAAAITPTPASTTTTATFVSELLATLWSSEHIEHDAYALLSAILEHVGEWFKSSSSPTTATTTDPANTNPTASNTSVTTNNTTTIQSDPLGIGASAGGALPANSPSPILRKCRYIQELLLKRFDPQLYASLTALNIEPQFFLMKWLRLLFGREFHHIEDTLAIWEALFAYDNRFSLVDYVATAMLMYVREYLLHKDYAACMMRLQHYPPVEDVAIIIEHALALTKPRAPVAAPMTTPATTTAATAPVATATATSIKAQLNRSAQPASATANTINTVQNSAGPISRPGSSSNTTPSQSDLVKRLELRVNQLEANQVQFASELQTIIDTLQREVVNPELSSALTDTLVLAIAELKRTKDTAFGYLPNTNM
jgi:TBC1 domain family protein 5